MKIALGATEGEVHLFLDEKGREDLIECLKELELPKDAKSHEHFHLFSEDWGADGLVGLDSAAYATLGLEPVHHLKVYMRSSSEALWQK